MEIEKGDIFLLGRHRLMCGDSLSLVQVEELLDGKKADMLFTDPPYMVNYVPEEMSRGKKQNKRKLGGIMGDTDDFEYDKFLKILETGIVKGAVYICAGDKNLPQLWKWNLDTFGREPIVIVWVKHGFNMGRRDYHREHEHVFYNWFDGKKFLGARDQSDVWYIKRRDVNKYIHPTQKPIAMPKKAILNSCVKNGIVLDLFGGSGSTLIAAEQSGRKCYMMELDPEYVEKIIERWEYVTGRSAEKL